MPRENAPFRADVALARDAVTPSAEVAHYKDPWRLILETALDAAIVMDTAGNVVDWNDRASAIFGWTRQETVGRCLAELIIPPGLRDAHARGVQRFLETGKDQVLGRRIEMSGLRKSGEEFPAELSISRVLDKDRTLFVGFVRDLGERKRAEEQLRRSQRMEAVGQLTGGVAHEFNNILMVILANVEAVLEGEGMAADVTQRMEGIAAATQRAANLTHQLLAFSRKQVLRPRPTNLNDLVKVTSELMRRTLGKHIEVKGMLADDLRFPTVDPAQLKLALVNICVNARDAMPGGGKLLIEARNVTLDRDDVARNPNATVGEYAMLSVTDTGSGMSPKVLERVYEPFFTTKEVGQGTGLGLSMVDGFIRQSNGHIEIESEVGRGTVVKLYLPVSTREAAMVTATARTSLPRGTERILVVEDDELVRAAVVHQLTTLGYAVTEAADGSAGLAALKTGQPYALLLTDVVMPGLVNGRRLAAEAVGLCPDLRVLFMSGYEDQIANAGVLDPRVTMLNKPFRKADLAMAVRGVLDGQEPR